MSALRIAENILPGVLFAEGVEYLGFTPPEAMDAVEPLALSVSGAPTEPVASLYQSEDGATLAELLPEARDPSDPVLRQRFFMAKPAPHPETGGLVFQQLRRTDPDIEADYHGQIMYACDTPGVGAFELIRSDESGFEITQEGALLGSFMLLGTELARPLLAQARFYRQTLVYEFGVMVSSIDFAFAVLQARHPTQRGNSPDGRHEYAIFDQARQKFTARAELLGEEANRRMAKEILRTLFSGDDALAQKCVDTWMSEAETQLFRLDEHEFLWIVPHRGAAFYANMKNDWTGYPERAVHMMHSTDELQGYNRGAMQRLLTDPRLPR